MGYLQEFAAWGLSKIAIRNIIVFFILLLLAQQAAVAVYFRAQLDSADKKIDELAAENRRCAEAAMAKIEQLQREHMQAVEAAERRQDKIERDLKKRRR